MDVIDIEWHVRCTLRVDMTYENFEKLLNWKGKHKKPFIYFLCFAFYFPFKFDSYCKLLLVGQKVLWKKWKLRRIPPSWITSLTHKRCHLHIYPRILTSSRRGRNRLPTCDNDLSKYCNAPKTLHKGGVPTPFPLTPHCTEVGVRVCVYVRE